MPIDIIDPSTYPAWNDRISAFPEATVFHTANWARVLKKAYGYEPVYLVEAEDGQFTGVLPLFHVQSILTGRRGVSIPFTDICPPLLAENISFDGFFDRALEIGRGKGWKTIELRGAPAKIHKESVPSSQRFIEHELDLNRSYEAISANFRNSTRRNIHKACKAGIAVDIETSYEAVCEFYRLNCMTRKDHGLPPQPFSFFKALHTHLIQHEIGVIALGKYQGKSIAGAVFLMFDRKSIYKYGASDRQYLNLRANNLVIGEGIRWLASNGYRSLHFGRTERGHKGLLQFKRGWGTSWKPFNYMEYDLRQNKFICHAAPPTSIFKCFSKVPIPLLKLFGQLAYRHVG